MCADTDVFEDGGGRKLSRMQCEQCDSAVAPCVLEVFRQASQEQMSSEQLKQQLSELSYFVGRELVKDSGHGNQEGEGNLFMLIREIWGSSFQLEPGKCP